MRSTMVFILTLSLLLLAALASQAQAPATQPAPAQATTPVPAAEESAPAVPPELTGKTRLEGIIINMQGALAGATYFSVEMERWSTPEEIQEAKSALASGGTKALLDKVWEAKQIGYLKIRNSMGKPIHYARAISVPGGYIVRLLADTPIAHAGLRSQDYPFCFIEMIIPTDGKKGHGTFVGMAQFSFAETGAVQVTAYGTLPVRLEEVILEHPKK